MSAKENVLYSGFDFYNINLTGDVAKSLQAEGGGSGVNEGCVLCLENHPSDSRLKICEDNVFQTLSSRMGTGGNNMPMIMKVYDARGNGGGQTVNTITGDHQNRITDYTAIACNNAVVRRLTPLECERLQGFPDGWTDIGEWTDSKGKKHKDADSPRYKALGNSIALPFWEWMAEKMVKEYDEPPTMASLFDGIGGFPLVFNRCGCDPVWASEIEEFPIAVTKVRFGDDNEV